MAENDSARYRGVRLARTLLRIGIGVACLVGAVLLVSVPAAGEEWYGLGLPEWGRWALGLGEIGAAGLFLWPSTSVAGGVLIAGVLIAALALHVAIGAGVGLLPWYLAGVVLWTATR